MKILFLCWSNVFRSQMAEAFFEKYNKNTRWKVESAAIVAPHEKMHALVVKAMAEVGIDLSKKKSKKVTKEMLDSADRIILMSPDLQELLNEKYRGEVETWNIPEIKAKETELSKYSEFLQARDIIEKKVKELVKTPA
ncbi:MAG: low molecular weight phosphatase family protein [archaeon]